MTLKLACELFESGRSHALTSDFLYRSALRDGEERGVPDPELFAFNGTYSLSIHYLLGLGLELMLKAANVAWGGPSDDKFLRDIGHDLVKAFDAAEAAGFASKAPRLREIIEVMRQPFKAHWFRYGKPDTFALPGDFAQLVEALTVLDEELRMKIYAHDHIEAATTRCI